MHPSLISLHKMTKTKMLKPMSFSAIASIIWIVENMQNDKETNFDKSSCTGITMLLSIPWTLNCLLTCDQVCLLRCMFVLLLYLCYMPWPWGPWFGHKFYSILVYQIVSEEYRLIALTKALRHMSPVKTAVFFMVSDDKLLNSVQKW